MARWPALTGALLSLLASAAQAGLPTFELTIRDGPLKPGRYAFFDEFHIDLPQGVIEAQ